MSTPSTSSTSTTPNKEGWWWAKTGLGWTCVRVRQLNSVWVGLNPYDGEEYPLDFLDSTFWEGTTWHGEAIPPSSQSGLPATLSEAMRAGQ
jgi:hypothetical protein